MACLGDDELVQMVRDFIESESTPPTESTSLKSHALTHRTKCYILQVRTSQIMSHIQNFICIIFLSLMNTIVYSLLILCNGIRMF